MLPPSLPRRPPHAAGPAGQPITGTPFHRYTLDAGRITFYLSADHSPARPSPLVLFIQGTGCDSHFSIEAGRTPGGLQSLLHDEAQPRSFLVLAVEKPGVHFLDQPANPSNAKNRRPEFVRDYSLDCLVDTIAAAVVAARKLPGVDRSRMLTIGHSEGSLVAVRASNRIRGLTHVAALSGGGPVYLFHMAESFRKQGLDPEMEIYPCWSQVCADPLSTARLCWGQTFRQWSSFMRTSIVEEALRSKSAFYFGHGSDDAQNPVSAFEVLRAERAARGRDAVFNRVEGAGHAFEQPGEAPPQALRSVFRRVLDWFGR